MRKLLAAVLGLVVAVVLALPGQPSTTDAAPAVASSPHAISGGEFPPGG